jgi:outer-membrane receptor for ferric coprogen and ferric-rhodotorulic acid
MLLYSLEKGKQFTGKPVVLSKLGLAISACLLGIPMTFADVVPGEEVDYAVEEVTILGVRDNRTSKGATGLSLSLKETPQSLTLVSRELMNDFGINNLNDALKLATGIQVEAWETNRTNYMARGFEIKNTQLDGVGMPNSWGIVTGEMDTFAYEKLEVVRGANGLLTGVGNASGTINYVRKRPTNDQQASVGISAGSFDFMRVEADYSTPFTESGDWAGRVVVAAEDEGSHLRDYENNREFFYGTVDGQLTDHSTLALGYSHQQNQSTGNLWGALVLEYSDGTQAEFPRNSSTSQNWTMWDTTDDTAFVEYVYQWSENWSSKLSYNHRRSESEDKLFYLFTGASGFDKETNVGLVGLPGNWPEEDEANLMDFSLNGKMEFWGREHEMIVGYSRGDSEYYSSQRPVLDDPNTHPAFGLLPAFPYGGDVIPEPNWGEKILRSTNFQTLERLYGSVKLNITDRFTSILGFNSAEYHRDGVSYTVPFDQTERELSPYVGLTYDLTDKALVYASYSDIYQPQDQQDIRRQYLDPSQGVNYEVGFKVELSPKLLATLARFKADQKSLATYAGEFEGTSYYKGVDVYSEGTELELVGKLTDFDQLTFGFTSLQLEGEDGHALYKWVPRETVNATYSTQLSQFPQFRFGLGARYQSAIKKDGTILRQPSYTTLNAFASWNVTDAIDVQVNINNLTNEKYLTSLYNVGFYSAPTQYLIGIDWNL